jgi:hypothetical protein
MSHFSHLLSKHGVLASFNIARKIKTKHLKSEIPDVNNKEEYQSFLNKIKTMIALEEKNQDSIDDIPGLIVSQEKSDMMDYFEKLKDNKKSAIIYASSMFSSYIASKNLTKTETLLAIQLIFNQLGISTDDLREFNKKFNPPPDTDDDEYEDGEDED